MVWEPFTRWERRKNAVMFFSSISKMDITIALQKMQSNDDFFHSEKLKKSNIILKTLHSIDDDVYKKIISFI